ncbi:hypothetical protein RPIT_08895 [Tessaracoccus flavus]|uniref:FecR protein domain-containing protein n=1 Tax=Tessaracoccus flavus TaxID=1610493 RepID=A0A1Q2CFJ1_9ACTN|nr:hypothetical protein RPIT_08895 [Tessaracoccus flavus]
MTACGGTETEAPTPESGVSSTAAVEAEPSPSEEPATEPAPEPSPTPPAAFAVLATAGTSTLDGAPGAAGAELMAGSVVEVTAGPVALQYPDGSVVRLDAGSTFTLGEGETRGTLSEGLSWVRVAPQSAGQFALSVGSAVVTAQGTAFAAGCSGGGCHLAVLEGAVDVDGATVAAGQALALTAGGQPTPAGYDTTFAHEFLKAAADADATEIEGAPDALTLAENLGPKFASWVGTMSGTRTVTACTGTDCGSFPVGDVADRTYTFGVDCTTGFPCVGVGTTTYGMGTETLTAELPMSYDGQQVSYSYQSTYPPCSDDTGQYDTTITWTWTADEAAVVDDAYVVTKATGEAKSINASSDPGSCGATGGTNDGALEVARD